MTNILIGLFIGTILTLIASCICVWRLFSSIMENFVLNDDFEEYKKTSKDDTDKIFSFIFDSIESLDSASVDYKKFKHIQDLRDHLKQHMK